MASAASHSPVSPEGYLEFERAAASKHEFWRGEVFAMAGASYAHNRIVANLLAGLTHALAGTGCVALHYSRRDDGTWVLHEYVDEDRVPLVSGGALELAALYAETGAQPVS